VTRVSFSMTTSVAPDRAFDAMVDFSDRRPELWPALHPETYVVHESGEGWAEVTEGSGPEAARLSLFTFRPRSREAWARHRYEWSRTDRAVRWTVVESSWINPPGPSSYRVIPDDGGSRIEFSMDRTYRGLAGRLMELAMRVAGRRMMMMYWKRHLELVAQLR
jgi:Polyketide cyclase / dehydrase and lipid transport